MLRFVRFSTRRKSCGIRSRNNMADCTGIGQTQITAPLHVRNRQTLQIRSKSMDPICDFPHTRGDLPQTEVDEMQLSRVEDATSLGVGFVMSPNGSCFLLN